MSEKGPNFTESVHLDKNERKEGKEMSKNVLLILKFIRHGERTKGGELTDYGRQVTRQKAEKTELSGLGGVKAVGSPFKPKGSEMPPRSLETADIYAQQLVRSGKVEKKYATKTRQILGPENLKTPVPFNWNEFYNSQLPQNFEELPDEEKAVAAHKAQTATVDNVLNMKEAIGFNHELASNFAFFVDTYLRMVERLKDGSKILYVAGTHGGLMEPFLKECLLRRDKEGQVKRGFERLEEIGGAFRPSDSFDVVIETDESGQKQVGVSFDDPNRLPGEELTLDLERLQELKAEYKEKHQETKT